MSGDILVVVARHRRPGRGPETQLTSPQLAAPGVIPRASAAQSGPTLEG